MFFRTPVDETIPFCRKMLLWFQVCWRGFVCVIIPLALVGMLYPFPAKKHQWCAYTLSVMAVFWVTECIPLPVTSFLPVVIFPLTNVMTTDKTCKCYINDSVLMFLGSLILAYAVEQSGLHRRLALCAVRSIGCSHYRLLFTMSFITMFVSMWITNTAATTMMVPILFAILKVFEDQRLLKIYETTSSGDQVASDITTAYFCALTYSATIGGIGTLVGTATNLVFKGLYIGAYPEQPEFLSFPKFSAFAIPYMLVMETLLYITMLIQYFGFLRPNSNAAALARITQAGLDAATKSVEDSWKEIGKITYWELSVIFLFSSAMILFFCRSPQIFVGWGDKIVAYFLLFDTKFVRDSAAAMLVAFLMFLLPSSMTICKNFRAKTKEQLPKKPVESVLRWNTMNAALPYSFMFLLGGGFALSEAANKHNSDLNGKIGEVLKKLNKLPTMVILLIVIAVTVFITNFASNVAVCNVIVPIAMKLAEEISVNPLWFNIASGFSASYCFFLPVGTPGNLIVQGAAKIPTLKMMKAGFLPTIMAIIVTWVSIQFWAPIVWPVLKLKFVKIEDVY